MLPLRTGTKTSCQQGGCGACTVMLSSVNQATGAVENKAVNACLRPLLSCDGQQITTSEGIGSTQGEYHPVQERIAECNGTQCGYCTPGHVMAMFSLLQEKAGAPLSRPEIEERFDGHICRCTGYRSIMKAVHSFASEGVPNEGDSVAGVPAKEWEDYDVTKEPTPPAAVAEGPSAFAATGVDGATWARALTLEEIATIQTASAGKKVRLVCGGTSVGVYPDMVTSAEVFIDISAIKELAGVSMAEDGLTCGSTTTLSQLLAALMANEAKSQSYGALAKHIKKVANWQVRNVGSWAGNLVMAKTEGFASDIATLMMGAGAILKVLSGGETKEQDILSFLSESDSMGDAIIVSITIPVLAEGEHLFTYRTAQRPKNAHAFVNACFRATVKDGTISNSKLAFGVVQKKAVFAEAAMAAMDGKSLDVEGLAAALAGLDSMEIEPEEQYHSDQQPEGKDAYRRNVASSFVYKFFLGLIAASGGEVPDGLKTAGSVLIEEKGTSTGKQTYETILPDDHPGKYPRPKVEAKEQASGQTLYHDDIQLRGQVYASLVTCTRAPAKIVSIDASAAASMPGFVAFLDHTDAPGASGSFAACGEQGGENLFAPVDGETLFVGQPVGMVVCTSRREAEAAAQCVAVEYADPAAPGIYSIAEAEAAGSYFDALGPDLPLEPAALEAALGETTGNNGAELMAKVSDYVWGPGKRVKAHGDVEAALKSAAETDGDTVVEGTLQIGGQSHFCMEKHTCVATPDEQGRMVIYASTQLPDHTRLLVAANLGLDISKVQVIVKRLGGSYGGKLDKSFWTTIACTAAANKLRRPVHLQNDIHTDMKIMGTARHPTKTTYKAAINSEGKITAFDIISTLNGGRCTGFAGFVAGEVLSNVDSVYSIPNLRSECRVVKTNTATNGAVRGPGLVQALAITENIIEHLAAASGLSAVEIRANNICETEEATAGMHGGPIRKYNGKELWDSLCESSELTERKAAVDAFNVANKWKKRGISAIPMKYGHAWVFAAGANVQVSIQAADANVGAWGGPSVKVFQPCIEMGQGLTTKIQSMVSVTLGVPFDRIYVGATDTDVLPNGGSGVTGGSVASEACCEAARLACLELLERMGWEKKNDDGEPAPPTLDELNLMVSEANGLFGVKKGQGVSALGGEAFDSHLKALIKGPVAGTSTKTTKVNLTAVGMFNPDFGGDNRIFNDLMGGDVLSYHTLGAACTEVELDVLTGETAVVRTDILYDAGHSMNPVIDMGQAEGSFLMGQGFFTQEETIYRPNTGDPTTSGVLTSDSTWEYKPPLNEQIPVSYPHAALRCVACCAASAFFTRSAVRCHCLLILRPLRLLCCRVNRPTSASRSSRIARSRWAPRRARRSESRRFSWPAPSGPPSARRSWRRVSSVA
eukprot:COSAG06_NODE_1960_length_7977_cov_3.230515_3_plen_1389_part_00